MVTMKLQSIPSTIHHLPSKLNPCLAMRPSTCIASTSHPISKYQNGYFKTFQRTIYFRDQFPNTIRSRNGCDAPPTRLLRPTGFAIDALHCVQHMLLTTLVNMYLSRFYPIASLQRIAIRLIDLSCSIIVKLNERPFIFNAIVSGGCSRTRR